MKGIRIPGFKEAGGKVSADRKAQLAKLPLPKRIAAVKGKKSSVRVVRRGTA